MSTPERGLAYLELPSEQINASTPAEFAQLLNRIMTAADMKASEVTIKVGKEKLPRSQAYSMVSADRTTLPSKPEQVRDFVKACRLAPVQVGLVMDLWTKLDQQARERATEAQRRLGENPTIPTPIGAAFNVAGDEPVTGSVLRGKSWPWSRSPSTPSAISYRPRAFVDLMFLVLEDDGRTRRALLLLVPLVLGFVAIVCIFVTWAILRPSNINMIGMIFAGGFLLPITTIMRSIARTHR